MELRVVSASGSETCVTSSMPTSAIIYDAYTSIKKKLSIRVVEHFSRLKLIHCRAVCVRFEGVPNLKLGLYTKSIIDFSTSGS